MDEREAAGEAGDGGDEARLLGRLQRLYRVLNGSIRRGRDEWGVERCPDDDGDVEHVQFGSSQPVIAGDEQAGDRPWATVGAHGLEGEQWVAICGGVNFSGGSRGRFGEQAADFVLAEPRQCDDLDRRVATEIRQERRQSFVKVGRSVAAGHQYQHRHGRADATDVTEGVTGRRR